MKVEEPVLLEEGDSEVELPAGEPELELLAGESELELTSGQAEAPVVKAVSKVSSNLRKKAGKKYTHAKSLINSAREYSLEEAVDLVKKTSIAKFDATVEAHFNLGTEPENQDQRIRTIVTLPFGTGKTVRVLVFADAPVPGADLMGDEALINKLQSGEVKPGAGFDVIVATPAWMPKLAKLGPVLGPLGFLPSPKNGTVTNDPVLVVENLKKGQIEVKSELKAPLVHAILGKVSFENNGLAENFKAVLAAIEAARPTKVKQAQYIKKVTLTSSMGPGVKVVTGD